MQPLGRATSAAALAAFAILSSPARAEPVSSAAVRLVPPATVLLVGETRKPGVRMPLKDCTRYNSRYGFYGNIWCSEREQQLWDRYEASRRRAKS